MQGEASPASLRSRGDFFPNRAKIGQSMSSPRNMIPSTPRLRHEIGPEIAI